MFSVIGITSEGEELLTSAISQSQSVKFTWSEVRTYKKELRVTGDSDSDVLARLKALKYSDISGYTGVDGISSRGYVTNVADSEVTDDDDVTYNAITISSETNNNTSGDSGAACLLCILATRTEIVNNEETTVTKLVIAAANSSSELETSGIPYVFADRSLASNKILFNCSIALNNLNAQPILVEISGGVGDDYYATADALQQEIQQRLNLMQHFVTWRHLPTDISDTATVDDQTIGGIKTFTSQIVADQGILSKGNISPSGSIDIGASDNRISNVYSTNGNFNLLMPQLSTSSLGDASNPWNAYLKDVSIASDVIPNNDSSYDIGSSSNKWNNIHANTFHGYLDGNSRSSALATAATYAILLKPDGSSSNTLSFSGSNLESSVNILPSSHATKDLGSSTRYWRSVYASTFYGSLSGNATTATTAVNATKATSDESNNNIKSSYAASLTKDGSFSSSTNTNKALLLKSKSGSTLSTVYLSDIIANALRGHGGTGSSATSTYGSVGSIGLFAVTSGNNSYGNTLSGSNLRKISMLYKLGRDITTISSAGNTGHSTSGDLFDCITHGDAMSGTWVSLSIYNTSWGNSSSGYWYSIILAVRIY